MKDQIMSNAEEVEKKLQEQQRKVFITPNKGVSVSVPVNVISTRKGAK